MAKIRRLLMIASVRHWLMTNAILRTRLWAGAALLLLTAAAVCFAPAWRDSGAAGLWVPAVVLASTGMAITGWRVRLCSVNRPALPPEPIRAVPAGWHLPWPDRVLILVGLVTLAAAVGLPYWRTPPERVQVLLLLLGLLSVMSGAAGLRLGHLSAWARGVGRLPWAEAVMLAGVFVLALAVRLWQLESGLRVLVDESWTIGPVVRMWEYDYPLLRQISRVTYPYPLVYPYMQQVGSAIFGYSLYTLRLPNAVYGALSVFAIYWLAGLLYPGRRHLPVMAALALAVLPFHMHFSRIGIINLYDPTLAALAFAFVIRGVRLGLRRDWALAGVMLGLTTYLYEGGRLLHVPMVLLWLAVLLVAGQASWRVALRGSAWALLVTGILCAPLAATWALDGDPLFGRLANQNVLQRPVEAGNRLLPVDEPRLVGRNLVNSFALYVTQPDEWAFYGGGQPILPLVVQPFFLMGLAAALVPRPGWSVGVLPGLWVLVTVVLLGVFIWNPLHAARHTVVMVAMALLVALGVWWAGHLLGDTRGWLTGALLIAVSAGQVAYYFGAHLPHVNRDAREIRAYADPDDAILRAADLPPNTRVYLITETVNFPDGHPRRLLDYVTRGDGPLLFLRAQSDDTYTETLFTQPAPGYNHAYFIESTNKPLIDALLAAQPDVRPSFSPDPRVPLHLQFALFYLPAEDISLGGG